MPALYALYIINKSGGLIYNKVKVCSDAYIFVADREDVQHVTGVSSNVWIEFE